jgi:UDP-N-acetylmuramoyl-tripeptide--D-alanyl-D-alanine ligase
MSAETAAEGVSPIPPLPWRAGEIAAASGGTLLCGRSEDCLAGISIDSRTIRSDECFLALRGACHDGHDFAAAVVAAGVRGLVIDRRWQDRLPWRRWAANGLACVAVEDPLAALGRLAAANRERSGVSLAAITGSNGKTSTRAMTAAVLSMRFATLASRGNFNNEIGLPLTLLRIGAGHRWVAAELGMNHPGEIGRLAGICRPDLAVITNVGPAHLEGLGSLEAIRRAKAEILEGLRPGGRAVLNGDDPLVRRIAEETAVPALRFGLAADAAVRAEAPDPQVGGTRFTLVLPEERIPVFLPLPGQVMVLNALAAAAVGHLAGISGKEIARGLAAVQPPPGRLRRLPTPCGVTLIDDTYNANPRSMAAAIQVLAQLAGAARTVLVAGDMLELGEQSAALHAEIGALAAAAGIHRILACGQFAQSLCRGAREAAPSGQCLVCGDKTEVVGRLRPWLRRGDWVLVKGSRGMRMETVMTDLLQALGSGPANPGDRAAH